MTKGLWEPKPVFPLKAIVQYLLIHRDFIRHNYHETQESTVTQVGSDSLWKSGVLSSKAMPLTLEKSCSFHPSIPCCRRERKVPLFSFQCSFYCIMPSSLALVALLENEQVWNNCERGRIIYIRAAVVINSTSAITHP